MYLLKSLARKNNILGLSGLIFKGESKLIQHHIVNLCINMLVFNSAWLMSQSANMSLKLEQEYILNWNKNTWFNL